jgi:hypothetical protein
MNFQDAEFMTAQEKHALLKQWEVFLKNGLKKAHFSKRIYDHLHLHCGFIALLKASVDKAATDHAFAVQLLSKLNL